MALALYTPWRGSEPPWSPELSPGAAFEQATWSDDAERRLSNHQDYCDQQRLAHASAKARRTAHTLHTTDSANGLNLDDFEDGGAVILDAIAMEAIGGKPAQKSMSKTLAAHLALVEASVASGTCGSGLRSPSGNRDWQPGCFWSPQGGQATVQAPRYFFWGGRQLRKLTGRRAARSKPTPQQQTKMFSVRSAQCAGSP